MCSRAETHGAPCSDMPATPRSRQRPWAQSLGWDLVPSTPLDLVYTLLGGGGSELLQATQTAGPERSGWFGTGLEGR